jgi:putative ABC transport system permease protein
MAASLPSTGERRSWRRGICHGDENRMSALNRKLLRDLLAMKGQAIAIALVVAAGVSVYVMYLSNFSSLQRARAAYYAQQRFADVFVSLKRAPDRLAGQIASLPGVLAIETRVVATVTLDLEQLDEPASGRLISIPADRRPLVNDLFLRRGRWIEPGGRDEVLASEGFAIAHRLNPGDQVSAVINGRSRRLTIVGIALSPEYIYSIRPGEFVPDDKRFGIFWMDRQALGAAFDMEGGFNDVVLRLTPGTRPEGAITQIDRLLEPYGGLGAIPRALQLSHWMVENELVQLQSFGFLLPLIFLLVAAFILNVALTRMLALQRAQIAALKALGYGNLAIGWHYLKWALMIGVVGVVIGLAGGAWFGHLIIGLYNKFFRFPDLHFVVSASVIAGAVVLTVLAAGAGAFAAVRRAVRVPPAEAMRPHAPVRYRRSVLETSWISPRLGTTGRMVLRNLTRHPLRAAASVFGMAFAVAILMNGLVLSDAMDRLIETQFWVAERQDVTVTFVEPRSGSARFELARLPGVLAVEPRRSVAVRVRGGHRERYVSLTGVPPDSRLNRIIDRDGRVSALPVTGVVVSKVLAEILGVVPGDEVHVDVLEGSRPAREVTIGALVDDTMGLAMYMDADDLHRRLREGDVASGALLLVDSASAPALAKTLKRMPAVAGAGFKRTVLDSFRTTMTSNMNLNIAINLIFAGIIAFGVVYNAARVSLSERSHELASLRVLGFTRAEISLILLGELAVLTLLALPTGAVFGYGLAAAIVQTVQSEVYRFPLYVGRQAIAGSFVGIIAAAAISGLVVRRRLDSLDLVAVLKVRE